MASEKYYQVKYANHTFHAVVLTKEHGHHNIKFGGKQSCVIFSVYDEEPEPNLDRLKWGSDCAVNVNVEPGRGTLIMAKAAIQFVYALFPGQGNMKFKDWSEIECEKGRVVPLAYYYLIKHGKTWYDHKFKAKPIDGLLTARFREINRLLDDASKKVHWTEFVDTFIVPCQIARKDKLVEALGKFYNTEGVDTYRKFFKTIMNDYDCIFLAEWMEYFVDVQLKLPLPFKVYPWVVGKKDIQDMNVVIDVQDMTDRPEFPTYLAKGGGSRGMLDGVF